MVQPGVERQALLAQQREAFPKGLVAEQTRSRGIRWIVQRRIGVPGGDVADAAEAVPTGVHEGDENGFRPPSERQIRLPDNPRRHARFSAISARAHGSDAVHKLGLTHWLHFHWPARAIHGTGLYEHRRHNVVAAACINQQLVDQVPPGASHPKMMVRIDDREGGFENRLLAKVEPFLAHWIRRRLLRFNRRLLRFKKIDSKGRSRAQPGNHGKEFATFGTLHFAFL
jgi:hypothetical protein